MAATLLFLLVSCHILYVHVFNGWRPFLISHRSNCVMFHNDKLIARRAKTCKNEQKRAKTCKNVLTRVILTKVPVETL